MKRIGPIARVVILAALAVSPAAAAHAQTPRSYEPTIPRIQPQPRFEPAVPRPVPDRSLEPSGELTPPAAAPLPPRLIQNQRRAQRDADARHCLTATSNRAIHRCAERYRPRASRTARVRKASAKPPAAAAVTDKAPAAAAATVKAPPPAVGITTKPDLAKPGAARPGDAAKAADLVKPMDVTKPSGTPRPVESGKAPEAAKAPSIGPRLPPMGSAADPTAAPPAKGAK